MKRKFVIYTLLVVGGVAAIYFFARYQHKVREKKKEERIQLYLWQQEWDEKLKRQEDSINAIRYYEDSLRRVNQENSAASSTRNRRDIYNKEDHDASNSSSKHNHGTTPDDGMFGFDYWDDANDEYHMERNQGDAYPDEKDW